MAEIRSEASLVPELVRWLRRTRRLSARGIVATEVPWHGRRVDFVVQGGKGRVSAFELKIGDTRRAIEQASWNALTFDRSYVVTASEPTPDLLALAASARIGLIHMSADSVQLLLSPRHARPQLPAVRRRLKAAISRKIVSL